MALQTSNPHSFHTTTAECAADAVIALINSRPRSPTRAEIAGVIAEFTPVPQRDVTGTAALALTGLGKRLLAVLPVHGEAVQQASSLPIGSRPKLDARAAATGARVNALVDAVLEAPDASLGDLAVACQELFLPGDYASDRHEAVYARLVADLLAAIGLTPEQCDSATWMAIAEEREDA